MPLGNTAGSVNTSATSATTTPGHGITLSRPRLARQLAQPALETEALEQLRQQRGVGRREGQCIKALLEIQRQIHIALDGEQA